MEIVLKIAELLYYLTGGPVLAYIAYRALKQIEVTKDASRTVALRESIRLAGEQIRLYNAELVPKLSAVDQILEKESFAFLANAKVSIEGNRVVLTGTTSVSDEEMATLRPQLPQIVEVLNQLETFAFYFTSAIAAEKLAYSSVGVSYVNSVEDLMPLIVMTNSDGEHHQATIRLFLMWRERREHARIERVREALEVKARNLKPREILPIGTR